MGLLRLPVPRLLFDRQFISVVLNATAWLLVLLAAARLLSMHETVLAARTVTRSETLHRLLGRG